MIDAERGGDYYPRRIVSLQPSATAILSAIGRLDCIVAYTKYCIDVCPDLKDHTRVIVADSWTAQSKQILGAHPDLVIAAVPYQEKAVCEILKSGARFLGLAPKTLADIYTDIASIAGMMNEPARGQRVIAEMLDEIEGTRKRVAGLPRPRVYCEEWGKPLIASQAWVAELIEAAGGDFIGTPGGHTSVEAVLSANPDIVIAAWCGAGDRVPLEKIIAARGWENMAAAITNSVYCIRDEFLNTPAPTLLKGLRALAGAIHPGLFSQPAGLRRISQTWPR